jgi:hypothetical protein
MTLGHTITRIIGTAELIGNRLPAYTTATAPSILKAARADGGRSSRGDHSDPTLRTVVQLLEPGDPDVIDAITATLVQLQWIRKQIETTIARNTPPRTDVEQRDHERTMRAGECLCGDPDCKLEQWYFAPDSAHEWAGYSQRCWERDRKRRQRGTFVPPMACTVPRTVVEPDRVESRAYTSTSSVWCHVCGTDYEIQGADAELWLRLHREGCVG